MCRVNPIRELAGNYRRGNCADTVRGRRWHRNVVNPTEAIMTALTQSLPAANATRSPLPYYLGAAADFIVGLELALFGPQVARLAMPALDTLLGAEPGAVLRIVGVALLVFALDTVLIARSQGRLGRLRPWIARANLATAALGVIALLVAHAALSPIGIAAVALMSVALLLIGWWQQGHA